MTAPRRAWPLLFPAAYLLHLAEEVWGGPGFVAWSARWLSPGFTEARFAAINGVAWPAMLAASLAAVRRPPLHPVTAALATIVLVNGALHLGSTLATGTYSPGVVTGVLVYLPLGGVALRRVAAAAPRGELAAGVGLGLALHALVSVVAFALGRG